MDIGTIIEGIETADVIITALAGSHVISEILPQVKKAKSNSTLQLICNVGRAILGALKK